MWWLHGSRATWKRSAVLGTRARSDGVGGRWHPSLCKPWGQEEGKQKRHKAQQSRQQEGQSFLPLLPQNPVFTVSIKPSVPKNTSLGFLPHCPTAACLWLSKPCATPLSPRYFLFSVLLFSYPSCTPLFPVFHGGPCQDGEVSIRYQASTWWGIYPIRMPRAWPKPLIPQLCLKEGAGTWLMGGFLLPPPILLWLWHLDTT